MPYRFVIVLMCALSLSVALCAALGMLLPGGWRHSAIGVMVLAIPAWIGLASWLTSISSPRRVTALLVGGNVAAWSLFFAATLIGPSR